MGIKLVSYKLCERGDVEALHKIIQDYFSRSPWLPTVESLMRGNARYFRAMLDDEQVGITGYVEKTPTLAETVKTTIFREFQGKGLGRLLSEAIEDECRKKGVKKVMTTIYSFNHTMIGIKLKQGYTIEGYHPDHEAPGFHEYSLGKVLR